MFAERVGRAEIHRSARRVVHIALSNNPNDTMPALSRYFSIVTSKLFAVAGLRFGLPTVTPTHTIANKLAARVVCRAPDDRGGSRAKPRGARCAWTSFERQNETASRSLKTRESFGAGNEARTRDLNLGKVALYQLSYSRPQPRRNCRAVSAVVKNNPLPTAPRALNCPAIPATPVASTGSSTRA